MGGKDPWSGKRLGKPEAKESDAIGPTPVKQVPIFTPRETSRRTSTTTSGANATSEGIQEGGEWNQFRSGVAQPLVQKPTASGACGGPVLVQCVPEETGTLAKYDVRNFNICKICGQVFKKEVAYRCRSCSNRYHKECATFWTDIKLMEMKPERTGALAGKVALCQLCFQRGNSRDEAGNPVPVNSMVSPIPLVTEFGGGVTWIQNDHIQF